MRAGYLKAFVAVDKSMPEQVHPEHLWLWLYPAVGTAVGIPLKTLWPKDKSMLEKVHIEAYVAVDKSMLQEVQHKASVSVKEVMLQHHLRGAWLQINP